MRLRRLGATGLALALALGIAACADETNEEVSGGSASNGTASTSEPTLETNSDEEAALEDEPEEQPTDTAKDDDETTNPGDLELAVDYSDPSQCIVGDWIADQGYFQLILGQLGDVGRLVSVTGEVSINYSGEGIITTYYDQWHITYEVEGHTGEVLRDGIDSGQYQINEDGTLDFWETNVGSVITASVAGMAMPIAPEPQDQSSLPVDCSESNMTIVADANPVKMTRR